MKTSTISALFLVLAIAQTQAFFTLFGDELRRHPNRQMTDVEATENEAESPEAEANAEHEEQIEPIGVTQHDITLLRRDILVSIERLRQTLERQSVRALHMPNTWPYPYYSNTQQ